MLFFLLPFLLVVLYFFLVCPRLPRRTIGDMEKFDYAHRGLWNEQLPENSLPAFAHAIRHGYGIELDVHLTRDGEMVVFHDDNLKRMCGDDHSLEALTLHELRELRLKGSDYTIPTFDEVLDVVDGATPLIVEIKTSSNHELLCRAVSNRMLRYPGLWCVESFDPRVVRWFKKHNPKVIRGQLSMAFHKEKEHKPYHFLCEHLLFNAFTRPDFIAYDVKATKSLTMDVMRLLRPTLVCWTIRSQQQMDEQRKQFDLQIFEGFLAKR